MDLVASCHRHLIQTRHEPCQYFDATRLGLMGSKSGKTGPRNQGTAKSRATGKVRRATRNDGAARARFMETMLRRISAGGPSGELWHVTKPMRGPDGKPLIWKSGKAKGLPKRAWIVTPRVLSNGKSSPARVPGAGRRNVFHAGHLLSDFAQPNTKYALQFAERNALQGTSEAKGTIFQGNARLIDGVPITTDTVGHLADDTRVPNFNRQKLARAPLVTVDNYDEVVPNWKRSAEDPYLRRRMLQPIGRTDETNPSKPKKTRDAPAGKPTKKQSPKPPPKPNPTPKPPETSKSPKPEPSKGKPNPHERGTSKTNRSLSKSSAKTQKITGKVVSIDGTAKKGAVSKIRYASRLKVGKALQGALQGVSVFGAITTFDNAVSQIQALSVGGRDPIVAELWSQLQDVLPPVDIIQQAAFGARDDTLYRDRLKWLDENGVAAIHALATPNAPDRSFLIESIGVTLEELELDLNSLNELPRLLRQYHDNYRIIEPLIKRRMRALFEITEDLEDLMSRSATWFAPFVSETVQDLWNTFYPLSQAFSSLHSELQFRGYEYYKTGIAAEQIVFNATRRFVSWNEAWQEAERVVGAVP